MNSKGIKVRPARPGVKPANKQLKTSVGDKVKNIYSLVTGDYSSSVSVFASVYRVQLSLCFAFILSHELPGQCSSTAPSPY